MAEFLQICVKVFQTRFKHQLVQWILSLPVKGRGRVALWVAKILMGPIKGKQLIPTLYGFNVYAHGQEDAIIERSIYYTGTYEKGTLYVLDKLLQNGSVFVDAGANIGLMSLFAASKVGKTGKVIAFEPYPLMYKYLNENIDVNRFSQITTYPYALGAHVEQSLLYPNTRSNPGASSLVQATTEVEGIPVQVKSLNLMIDDKQPVDVIKIDVEGYELEVLKGAEKILRREQAPALIVECSGMRENFGYTPQDLFNYLSGINHYKLFKLKEGKGNIGQLVEVSTVLNLPEHDNLFCLLPNHLTLLRNG